MDGAEGGDASDQDVFLEQVAGNLSDHAQQSVQPLGGRGGGHDQAVAEPCEGDVVGLVRTRGLLQGVDDRGYTSL